MVFFKKRFRTCNITRTIKMLHATLLYHYRPCTQTCTRIFFLSSGKKYFLQSEKKKFNSHSCYKKNDEKKKRKIKRIFRAHCPKCFKKEMAWQSHKDKRKRKRKREREKEQLVARTTLMITEKAERLWIPSACSLFYQFLYLMF